MLYFLCNPNEIHPSSNRASVIGCFGWFGNNQCDLRSDRGLMCTLIYFIRSIKIEFFFFFFWFMPLNMPMISYHHLSSDSHRTHNNFFLIHHWLKCQAIGAAQYNIPHDLREEVRKKKWARIEAPISNNQNIVNKCHFISFEIETNEYRAWSKQSQINHQASRSQLRLATSLFIVFFSYVHSVAMLTQNSIKWNGLKNKYYRDHLIWLESRSHRKSKTKGKNRLPCCHISPYSLIEPYGGTMSGVVALINTAKANINSLLIILSAY